MSLETIQALRGKTGVSLQACKKALEEADGDLEKAITILRKKGQAKAVERAGRETGEGVIVSYVHGNSKLGALIQLGCETDFVARSADFQTLARDLSMHVAASNPLYVAPEDVPPELVEKEREIWKAELAKQNKPEKMLGQIMQGKEKKFREEISLLTQPFVKNPEIIVEQLIKDAVMKLGENIRVVRFSRFSF